MSRILRSLILTLALLLGFALQVKGQGVSSDYYDDKTYTLVHRAGHWYDSDWRGKYAEGSYTDDTFDEDGSMTTAPEGTVQNTHVYVDTIYMQKGQTVPLHLPILHQSTGGTSAAGAYIRWYNYRTGKTFSYTSSSTNDRDLLYPMNRGTNTDDWGRITGYYNYMYRDFDNGYFGGKLFGLGHTEDFARFQFYYPTDTEATNWGFNSTSNNNDDYIVACDISPYPDGSLSNGTITEPSLSQRVIYFISGMANDTTKLGNSDENFWKYINDCRKLDQTTGKRNRELAVDDPNKKYYVTYDIDFPFTRFDKRASYEMVVLNKGVDHYYAPGAASEQVTVTLKDNTDTKKASGIKLIYVNPSTNVESEVDSYNKDATKTSISPRCIRFSYPKTNDDGTQEVLNEDATASIYVTNSVGDGLVRFNLTFTKGQRLLTQSEVNKLEEGEDAATDITYSKYKNRTPSYLAANYQLITSLDMNYNRAAESISGVTADRQNQQMASKWCRTGTGVYPFPMKWSYSNYGFMDGSNVWEGHSSSVNKGNLVAEWGEYSFVNKYVFDNRTINKDFPIAKTLPNGDVMIEDEDLDYYDSNSGTNYYSPTNYFLYVDAASEPGVIARIPFREALCPGSELFLTGWVKNGTDENPDNVDAAILMSIVAARLDSLGNETETHVISRHSTGMFPHTALCSRYGGSSSTRESISSTAKEEWLQFFYSLTMPATPFDSLASGESVDYYLELQNNAVSSSGADYYLDDICIYMVKPTVEVTQVTPTCTSSDTRMQIRFDYDMILSRFGLKDQTDKTSLDDDGLSRVDINFVLIDSLNWVKGDSVIRARTDLDNVQKNDTCAAFFMAERIPIALLKDSTIVNGDQTTHTSVADAMKVRQTMVFYNAFDLLASDENYAYDNNMRGYNVAYVPPATTVNPNPYPRWRVLKEGNKRYLVADISVGDGKTSLIQTGRRYYVAMSSTYEESSSIEKGDVAESEQVSIYDAFVSPCGYRGTFVPHGSLVLQTTGTVVTPDMEFCTGQVNNFTAKLRIYENGEAVDVLDGYFDWFFDKETVYNAVNETYGVSLKDALFQLREIYPDLTLTQLDTLQAVKKGENELTENMIELIKYYTQQESAAFLNPMLVLHEQAANMRISMADGEIVVYPSPIMGESLEGTMRVACFDPIPIQFKVTGTAPEIHLGYEGETYGSAVQAGLRLGLEQLSKHTSDANPIILPIRNVSYGSTGTTGVDHLGIIKATTTGDETTNDHESIYLVGTDDPTYSLTEGMYAYPIGKLTKLYASETNTADNTLQFFFDEKKFKPHEGFTYNVNIWFGEMDADDKPISTTTGSTSSTCYGSLIIPIKIVPKYLRWDGVAADNWNNDDYWKRSVSTELYKTGYDDYADVLTASKKKTNLQVYNNKGFAPMAFSYVTIPDSAQVQLYQPEVVGTNYKLLNLAPASKPADIQSATKNIQYDLVYKEKTDEDATDAHHTLPYYTNTVGQIHFRPFAEMLHAEYLSYERAYVDMKLPTAEWSLVSTPFAKTYSGEFYTTKADGLQKTELFVPITFNTTTYDRFAPAIYLRSYVGTSAIRLDDSNGSTTSMALTGHWSGVYNKVDRVLALGQAFSVKPVRGNATEDVGDSVIVRLPKGDTSYSYYYDDSDTGSKSTEVSKDETDGANRYSLAAYDGILPENATAAQTFSTSLTAEIEAEPATSEQWYILGNPFVSHMKLAKFFAKNTAFDATTYRTADGTSTTVTSTTLIAPLSAFYAKLTTSTVPTTLTFTADMEALGTATSTTSTTRGLRLTALAGDHESRAVVLTAATASNDYLADEDAELFVPDADELPCPIVYTVAGNVATTVNRTPSLQNLPIGLISADDEDVSVRFDFEGLGEESSESSSEESGGSILSKKSILSNQSIESKQSKQSTGSSQSTASSLSSAPTLTLYDALLATTTTLESGSVVKLTANAHGRYFLNFGTSSATDTGITIYSANRELVVSCTADPLTRVEVYTPDGRRVLTAAPAAHTFTTALPTGIYIVRAATADKQSRAKVRL